VDLIYMGQSCECSDLLEKFGWSTNMQPGLTLDMTNLESFQQKFEQVVSSTITEAMLTPMLDIDMSIDFDVITPKFFNILKQMAHLDQRIHGPCSKQPMFLSSILFRVLKTNMFVFGKAKQ
jgi:single-stranded-DNA-specific exonuclease